MYKPTKTGLEHLWDLVVPGGMVLFDEYGIRPWGGESKSVDEFFQNKKKSLQSFNWCPNPAYLLKG